MAGRNWLDAVLGLGPEWKVTRVEPTPEAEGASGGAAPDRAEPVEVSSLRRGVPGLRHAPSRMAESGRLGLQDLSGLQRPAGPVPAARGGDDPGALGGGEFEVHGPVRGGGDRVAEGSERQGGRGCG